MNRRQFMQRGIAGVSGGSLGTSYLLGRALPNSLNQPHWPAPSSNEAPDAFVACTRRYGLDTNLIPFHAMPFDKFDPERYVDTFLEAKVNSVYHTVTDCWGYSLYDTKVGYKSTHFQIDVLGEVIKYAHRRNLKVCAYYCLGWQDQPVVHHPNWSRVDADGNPFRVNWSGAIMKKWGWPCVNTPYRQYLLDQLHELARNYAIDIMFIDMLYQDDPGKPGCYCEDCKRAYRERFGYELPTKADWGPKWKQQVTWRLDVMEKLWEDVLGTFHQQKPGMPVTRNYFELWSRIDRARLAAGEKYINAEDGPSDSRASSAIATVARGLTGRKAFTFTMATDFKGVQDWPSPYRYKMRVMNILAQGGVSLFGDSRTGFYPDGSLEKQNFRYLGDAFEEFSQKEQYIRGTAALPYVGIVFSEWTRLFYSQNDIPGRFSKSLEGAVSALLGLHIPVNCVPDWKIESGTFQEDKILILPNAAAMSRKQAEELRAYVKDGGLLLASFETSLYNEMGEPLPDFQLADVFGLKYLGRSDQGGGVLHHQTESYLTWRDHPLFSGLPHGSLRLMGPYIQTEPVAGETLAFQRDPAELMFEGKRVSWGDLPGQETRYPAVHLNHFGKGKAIFLSSKIFQQCSVLPASWPFGTVESCDPRRFWWLQKLVANSLRLLDPLPSIWLEAPSTVEATFWRRPSEKVTIVQLFNKTQMDTLIPVQGTKLMICKGTLPAREAYMPWPNRRALRLEERADIIEIGLPSLGLHEVILLS